MNIVLSLKGKLWRRRDPIGWARSIGVKVGDDCRFLGISEVTFGSEPYLIKIGNHVTITDGVKFSTHDGGVWVFRYEHPDIDVFGPIEIGDNVFLGFNTVILPNVKIGSNCVIGAGAVVTRDIPNNSVAVGSPARVIRNTSEYLQKVDAIAMHIRKLSPEDKRARLERHFKIK